MRKRLLPLAIVRMMHAMRFWPVLLACALGCSTTTGSTTTCSDGDTRGCSCDDGARGGQQCLQGAWSACACVVAGLRDGGPPSVDAGDLPCTDESCMPGFPDGGELPPFETECANGIDDEGDLLTDCDDPDCIVADECMGGGGGMVDAGGPPCVDDSCDRDAGSVAPNP